MKILTIIGICLWLTSMLVPGKHALHMFQQNRYECARFTKWLRENGLAGAGQYVLPAVLSAATAAAQLLWGQGAAALAVSGAVLTAVRIVQERGRSYIKPLVYTNRVKRQIAVMAGLAVICAAGLNLVPVFFRISAPLLSACLPWLLIYPMAVITAPIEKAGRTRYLNEAKAILNQHADLIRIGITGSYGKTSTKNVIQSIVSEQYMSLMTPASYNTPMGITRTIRELLKPIHQVFVCEMGADHVGDITELMNFVHPSIGVVTSIGPQHLQTFGSQDNITREKMQMIELLPPDGTGILNYDNELIRAYEIKNPVRILTYGIRCTDVDFRAVDIDYGPYGSSFKVQAEGESHAFESKLLGELNILNILSAVAVARTLAIPWPRIQRAVREMKQVEHRLEKKIIGGYSFIDDAFNANPSGAAMALEVLAKMPGKRIIVTPGMIELGERQDEINHTFGTRMKGCADEVILVGEKQVHAIRQGLEDSGYDMSHVHVLATVKEAFDWVWKNATPADTILLENDLPDAFNH